MNAMRMLVVAASFAIGTTTLAQPVDVFDGFVDGAVSLVSVDGSAAGDNYSAPSVPAGRRTIAYINSTGSGTLTLDDAANTLALTTTGQGTYFLGYGWSTVNGSGVQNDYAGRLDADWSEYVAVRIPVLVNDVRMRLRLNAGTQRLFTDVYFGESDTGDIVLDGGWTGVLDVPLSSFAASGNPVDWADVDRFLITAQNTWAGSDFTLGPIQLVRATAPEDLDGDGAVAVSDLALLIGAWGPCPEEGPCPADLDGDGMIGASDLARLIAAWG
jgi:hypothetical protein